MSLTDVSQDKILDMLTQETSQLGSNNKKELVALVHHLREKVEALESYKLIATRVRILEKNLVSTMQYSRRENIEIHNIPQTVADDKLEETCLKVLDEIGCGKIKSYRVMACHRLKNRDKTVIRFITRKHADAALHNRGKLKSIDMKKCGLPAKHRLYINESLCRPLEYLHYITRCAFKLKKIFDFNLWKGRLTLQMEEGGENFIISHIEDLIEFGLASDEDRAKFMD